MVSLPDDPQNGESVEITKDDNMLSMQFLGIKDANSKKTVVEKAEAKPKKSTGKKRKIMTGSEIMKEDLNTNDSIEYTDLYADTNVRYDITPNTVKESIVIGKAAEKKTVYQYLLSANGLKAILNKDNSVSFFKNDDKKQETPIFYIPAPYMFDKNDVYSYDIKVKLQKTANAYTLSYIPNQKWLEDTERAFPVVLDPSVNVSDGIQDTYTYSAEAYKSTYLGFEQQLKVGKSAWLGPNDDFDTYIKFSSLPTLPGNYVINSSILNLCPKSMVGDWQKLKVGVYEVTQNWSAAFTGSQATSLNYNTRPTSKNYAITTTEIDRNMPSDPIFPSTVGFEISSLVSNWYRNPGQNFGMRLSLTEPQTNPWNSIAFYSSRGVNVAAHGINPVLSIIYSPYVPAEYVTYSNSPENNKMQVGATCQLQASVMPTNATNKKIKWNSESPEVATIDENGLITAVSPGTTYIQISADDTTAQSTPSGFFLTVTHATPIIHKPDNDTLSESDNWQLVSDPSIPISIVSSPTASAVIGGWIYPDYPLGKITLKIGYEDNFILYDLNIISPTPYFQKPANDTLIIGTEWELLYLGSYPTFPISVLSGDSIVDIGNGKIKAVKTGKTTLKIGYDDNFITYELTVTSKPFTINKPANDTLLMWDNWQLVSDPSIPISIVSSTTSTEVIDGWVYTYNPPGKMTLKIGYEDNFVLYELTVISPSADINKPANDTLFCGDTWHLNDSYTDGPMSVVAGNSDVVTIKPDGWITANKPGKVTIKIGFNDDNITLYELTVVSHPPILNKPQNNSLWIGDAWTLSLEPTSPITKVSGNVDFTDMGGGTIMVHSAGTIKFKIGYDDNPIYYELTVRPDITITTKPKVMYLESGLYRWECFQVELSPHFNPNYVHWDTSDYSIAEIGNVDITKGVITLKKEGKVKVTATCERSEGYGYVEDSFDLEVTYIPLHSIVISGSKSELFLGEDTTLTATPNPFYPYCDYLNWSADNENVTLGGGPAALQRETVYAFSPGLSTITASVDNVKSNPYTINIKSLSVAITNSTVPMLLDDPVRTLTCTVNPSYALTKWFSSNENVARIEDGKIVPISNGETYITVKAKINSDESWDSINAVSATFRLIVGAIAITKKPTSDLTVNDTFTLEVSKTPSDLAVAWGSDKSHIASVDKNGKITAIGVGTATITVSAVNNPNIKDTCTVTVKAPTSSGNYKIIDNVLTYKAYDQVVESAIEISNQRYGSKLINICEEEVLLIIKSKAYGNVLAGPSQGLPTAATFLNNFLNNTGSPMEIDFKKFIEDNRTAEVYQFDNIDGLVNATEKMLLTNGTVKIGSINALSTCKTPEAGGIMTDDWWYSVGATNGWINAEVTRSGNNFTAHVYYHLRDFYDWKPDSPAKGGLVTDGEMAELHAAGWAKEYEITGLYEMRVEWALGERVDSGLTINDWS